MKNLFYYSSITVLALFMFTTGCTKEKLSSIKPNSGEIGENLPTTKRLSATQSSFSDEDLFVGIFFLKGSVSNEVDALVNLKNSINNGELNLLSNRATNVVNFINIHRPDFFSNFGKQLRTGDHQSVSSALDYAVGTMNELGISNGEGPHVVQQIEAGKNCHKWIIINHFLIKRKLDHLTTNTGNINAPEVLLEKEILVADIVASFQ